MTRHRTFAAATLGVAQLVLGAACGDGGGGDDAAGAASGAALVLEIPVDTDVVGFEVSATPVTCGGGAVLGEAAVLEVSLLDLDLSFHAGANGSHHLFADAFLPLLTGCYDVVSQPLANGGAPSSDCAAAGREQVVVQDGTPVELLLVSPCGGQQDVGAIDVISTLNRPPFFVAVDYPLGEVVTPCETQRVCVTFGDLDGDPLELEWVQVAGLPAAAWTPLPPISGPGAPFTQCVELAHGGVGMVLVEVTAFDLVKDPDGAGLVRVEDLLATSGYSETSHATVHHPARGSPSADCPCVPHGEVCDGEDNDCDGEQDEGLAGCGCIPGSVAACYDGPPGTGGVGKCVAGLTTCSVDGAGFGDCEGAVTPTPEMCGDGDDDDCDGVADDPADCGVGP